MVLKCDERKREGDNIFNQMEKGSIEQMQYEFNVRRDSYYDEKA
jgi:phage head maturation protease